MAVTKVGSLVVDLIAESAKYIEELKKANQQTGKFARDVSKSMNRLATTVAGMAAGYLSLSAVIDSANRSMANAKELENMARLAGQSVEEFQATAYAVDSVGISAEQLGDISKDVSDKLGDFAATGGGEFADFFENVAPQVGLTSSELMKLSGPEVLLAVQKAMEDANVPMKEQIFYLESIANDASLLIPLLENNGRAMGELEGRYRDMNVALSETDISALREMEKAFKDAKREAESLSDTIWVSLSGAMTELARASADFFAAFRKNIEESPAQSLQFRIESLNKQLAKSEGLAENYYNTITTGAEEGASANQKMGAAMAQVRYDQEIEKQRRLVAQINNLQGELDELNNAPPTTHTIDITYSGDSPKQKVDEDIAYISERMQVFIKDVQDVYTQIDKAAISWSQSFSKSLTDMILTGEASFSDFATQVVSDLIRIMIQAQITEPFLRAVTNIASDFGITPTSSSSTGSPAAKATGGPVMKGSTYLVGENGPELFTASNSGNITPNSQIGGGTVVNIYPQPGETAETRTRSTPQGDIVEVFMKQIDSRMNEQISRGQGLARTLEGRYSLTRKAY